jgi:hypothetical protein
MWKSGAEAARESNCLASADVLCAERVPADIREREGLRVDQIEGSDSGLREGERY